MDLLHNLNKQQKEAVLHTEGPLLILAGAGSGKTRVLTHRIAYLIKENGVHPSSILAITFTNKAAREMKERVEKLLGELSGNMWISTFHSTCLRILRRDIEKLGFDRNFVIFDTSDQLTVIKDCLKELKIDDRTFPPRSVQHMIGRAKDELLEPSAYMKCYATDFRMGNIARIYELYQKKLKQNNALDFDDIIMYTIKLFMENPPVLEYYQNKFKYVLVDEYQDTNTAQYHLISLLAHKHKNLCVVGDDDQSIYGFRGANIRNILDFEKEFVGCKVIKLEQNYRSTQIILDAANSVIKNNCGRKNKRLWTDNGEGRKIIYYKGNNEHEEAMFVAREIIKLKSSDDRCFKDVAVLYRMNAQSRVLEDMFMKEGISYNIFGGLRFYDRKEIKDVIAYLRLIQNPSDDVALKRIINVPKRGIGNVTVSKAEDLVRQRESSIFSIISSSGEIPDLARVSSKLQGFVSLILQIKAMKESIGIPGLIEEVINRSGMLRELEKENTVESQSRIENIKELVSVAVEFEQQSEDLEMEQGLEDFLANISLVSDIDTFDENQDSVVMMTLHSAKGLEFPVVFMVGMEEGVFPGYRSMSDDNEIEEERRLCYVGITRAEERLYLTNAYSRTLFGNTTYNMESRFIKEISPELIENCSNGQDKVEESTSWGFNAKNTNNFKFGLFRGSKPISLNDIKKDKVNYVFSVGDRVEHKKFGKGTITLVEELDEDFKLEIQFDGIGMKRLMAALANLKKIN
ncbi:MAG: DNA helicase PcrA [Acetivibrionales bacterium]|jgi:DNA helicase-2/ATP-dependent DNA helicase PcrA